MRLLLVLSLARVALLAAFVVALALVAWPARAAGFADALASPTWSWALVPVVAAVLLGLGWLGHRLGAYLAARTHSTRVAGLFDTLSSVAEGIALTVLQHPPAPADVVEAVKQALIAQGVAYAKTNLPDTIKAVGISDDTIAARLTNAVAGAINASRLAPDASRLAPDASPAPAV